MSAGRGTPRIPPDFLSEQESSGLDVITTRKFSFITEQDLSFLPALGAYSDEEFIDVQGYSTLGALVTVEKNLSSAGGNAVESLLEFSNANTKVSLGGEAFPVNRVNASFVSSPDAVIYPLGPSFTVRFSLLDIKTSALPYFRISFKEVGDTDNPSSVSYKLYGLG